ncbi:MAG: gliding motility-associated C-terminal domain-containing protein, partial [Bacteroidota bacterium]
TTLVLKNAEQQIIHTVTYRTEWFGGSFKKEGGWSLEMIDPDNPCGCNENWAPSQNVSGGTPGRVNSVEKPNPDQHMPYIKRAVISDTNLLQVFFSESIDSSTVRPAGCWTILPDMVQADDVLFNDVAYKSVRLHIAGEFKASQVYILKSECYIKDCAGNQTDTNQTVRFALPDHVGQHEIVINEILPDPFTGGSRFIELYNRSEKILDLSRLVISRQDTSGGLLPGAIPLSDEAYLLFPGDYVAITTSPEDILEKYYSPAPDAILEMSDLPAFDNDSGIIVLARNDNIEVIDKVHYHPEMHFPLLATKEGVSLERLNPDRPSFDETNWHSAAETVGFATPGYQNSHGSGTTETNVEIDVGPELFSPDNDGKDDIVNIEFKVKEPYAAVSISIYDSRGRLVVTLANNILLSAQEIFSWNGLTGDHNKAPIGSYIIFIELTKPEGMVIRKKATVFLCGKI